MSDTKKSTAPAGKLGKSTAPAYKKNDLLTLTITDLTEEGFGIGKQDGFAVFVQHALPGDKAEVSLTKVKKNYAYGRVVNLITPSPDRVEPACPVSRPCGGCQLQSLSYEGQIAFKENMVRNRLLRIGGFSLEKIDEVWEDSLQTPHTLRYRNKAQYPIGTDKEGNPVAGFYAGRTHSIIPVTDCLLTPPEFGDILQAVLSCMKRNRIPAYDETTGRGLLRHVLLRKSFSTGEILACLIVNSKKDTFNGLEVLKETLRSFSAVAGVCINYNTENTNVIMGDRTLCVWGKDRIPDTLTLWDMSGDMPEKTDTSVTYEISARSFYQVNAEQAERLYSVAAEYAGLTGKETVWDLYCGIGTITLFMAQKAGRVCGVEIIPDAIEDAERNARANHIENARFFCGKAEEVLPAYYEDANAGGDDSMLHPDVIVVDPPRKGCDEACLSTMLQMQPDRIVYVSCDSSTLARDLKILCEGGYELKKIRLCDQFCQTLHVETVCLLSNTMKQSTM